MATAAETALPAAPASAWVWAGRTLTALFALFMLGAFCAV